jgi:phospholipase/carboxylesterase
MLSEEDHLPGMSRRRFVRMGAGALATPLFLGCGNSADPGPDDPLPATEPRLTARPGAPVAPPTLGSSQLELGGVRDGFLYVPATYTPDTPMPLFVALHGYGGGGHEWSIYNGRAEARGMIVLAPDSRDATWDVALGGFGPDVAFLDEALRYTFEHCRVDPSRIALAGFSDGASYALSLGVSNGDLFSHLIAYSPGFYLPSNPIVGKPPVFVSHGTEDQILSVTTTRDSIVPRLRALGYDVDYEEFIGTHEVPPAITESSLNWFLG